MSLQLHPPEIKVGLKVKVEFGFELLSLSCEVAALLGCWVVELLSLN